MGAHDFSSPSVKTFLETLGSPSPTPGGGTGAAVTGAMGASLVQMLAELTIGKKKYADHDELMKAIRDEAVSERDALLELAAKDAAAYDGVGAAFQLPKETDDEKAARRSAIQDAMKGACEVPLEVMQHCVHVIGIAKNAVQRGNKNAVSDGAAGAEMARAGMKIASYNVMINLVAIKDEAYVKITRTRMDEMAYMGTAVANEIDSHVREMWTAKPAPAGGQ